MLWRVTDIQDYSVWATDGDLGELDQFYIDVIRWAVRYLVVDTGAWLPGRKVLAPMIAVQALDRWGVFHLTLTRAQIHHCPPVDPTRPISRAAEHAYIRHYGLPLDWGEADAPSGQAMPQLTPGAARSPYLLSTRTLAGFALEGPGGAIGHVKDCLIDDETWTAPYLIIGTGHWLPGEWVLAPTARLGGIDLGNKRIFTLLTHEQVRAAPEIDPTAPLSDEMRQVLDRYYQAPAAPPNV